MQAPQKRPAPTDDSSENQEKIPRLLLAPEPTEYNYDMYSFCVQEEHQAAYEFFLEHGFVVLRQILIPGCAGAFEREFFETLEKASGGKFRRNDKSTWTNENMPYDHQGMNNFSRGFVGMYHLKGQWIARTEPKLRRFCEILLKTDNIWPSIDRMGFMRPGSKNRTSEYFWHWDQNPLKDPGFCRIQGLVAVKDCPIEVGGFQVIPKSHKQDFLHYGSKFARESSGPASKGSKSNVIRSDLVNIPVGEEGKALWSRGIKVPLRQGDVVLWDSRTAHGNFPNTSNTDYRLVSYLTYGRAPSDPQTRKKYIEIRRKSFETGKIEKSNRDIFFAGFMPARWANSKPERNPIPNHEEIPWDCVLDSVKAGLMEELVL